LFVVNKKEDRTGDFSFELLRKINSNLKEKISLNLKYAASRERENYNELIEHIKTNIIHLPHIGEPVPKTWRQVRERIRQLQESGKKAIKFSEFQDICRQLGIKEVEKQRDLAKYFNDIGVFLYVDKDDLLKRWIFIDNQWILNAAYKIIDDVIVEQKRGRLTAEDFEKFYTGDYAEFIPEIKAMLKYFKIVYEKDGFIVVPQKLPEYKEINFEAEDKLQLVFRYEKYLPKEIIWKFIVENKDYISGDEVWRYGVVLSFDKTKALVREEYDGNKISITVTGERKVDVRAMLMGKIEDINKEYEGLEVDILVSCVCDVCRTLEEPEYYEYEKLLKRKRAGKKDVFCSKKEADVPLEPLLEGIYRTGEFGEGVKKQAKSDNKKLRRLAKLLIALYFVIIASLLAGGGYLIVKKSYEIGIVLSVLSGIGLLVGLLSTKAIDFANKVVDFLKKWREM